MLQYKHKILFIMMYWFNLHSVLRILLSIGLQFQSMYCEAMLDHENLKCLILHLIKFYKLQWSTNQ